METWSNLEDTLGKLCGIVIILFFSSIAFGIGGLFSDLFEGFQDSAEYKSSIPCESQTTEKCSAVQGPMGKALDTASEKGLEIKKIVIKKLTSEDSQIFVETAQTGVCFVDPKDNDESEGLKFSCSLKELKNNKLQSIDKVVLLKKNSDQDFSLEDITQKQNLTR